MQHLLGTSYVRSGDCPRNRERVDLPLALKKVTRPESDRSRTIVELIYLLEVTLLDWIGFADGIDGEFEGQKA